MCMPNRSWFTFGEKIIELPNVQSHGALRELYNLPKSVEHMGRLKDREIFVPDLLGNKGKKIVKDYLLPKERRFLFESLKNFNNFKQYFF